MHYPLPALLGTFASKSIKLYIRLSAQTKNYKLITQNRNFCQICSRKSGYDRRRSHHCSARNFRLENDFSTKSSLYTKNYRATRPQLAYLFLARAQVLRHRDF